MRTTVLLVRMVLMEMLWGRANAPTAHEEDMEMAWDSSHRINVRTALKEDMVSLLDSRPTETALLARWEDSEP